MIIKQIKRGFNILLNPNKEFKNISKIKFEEAVADYFKLLVSVAIVAGIANFIIALIKAAFLDITLNIDIQYLRMINYSIGRATSLVFFYIFAGTFILFFVSIILRIFIRKVKYVDLFRILFYSLMPLLLFGWLPFNQVPLLIWCSFLLAIALRQHRSVKVKKGSINQRD